MVRSIYQQITYLDPVVYDWAHIKSKALVLGGEGKGIHEMVRKRCHRVIRIPMAGKISSLNVSVASGIVLFDWKRRQP